MELIRVDVPFSTDRVAAFDAAGVTVVQVDNFATAVDRTGATT